MADGNEGTDGMAKNSLSQGYGIMLNSVLFDNELSDKQKLLYCLISSLCAEKGFCWASNEYIGELLNADKRTISRNLSELQKSGYISIEIENKTQRKITLDKNVVGGRQKCLGEDRQKCLHNITTTNTTSEKKEGKEKKAYGEFNKCYLTDKQYAKVIEKYGTRNGERLIKDVDNYCARTGKKYENYLAAINTFAEKGGIKEIPKSNRNESGVYDLPF